MSAPFSISPDKRRIDPARQRAAALKADGSVDDNDRTEIGPTPLAFTEWRALGLEAPNLPMMREYRLQRIREQLVARDLGGILLFDPLNIRYATDTTNMQLWTTHNPARACFIAASGHVVLWDFHGCDHLSAHLPLVSELRSGASFFYFETGERYVGIRFYLGSSKGDRQNIGREYKTPSLSKLCPVEAYLNWIEVAGITRGGVFRGIDRWGNISEQPIVAHSLIPLLRGTLERCGLPSQIYSAHSIRRGFATWAASSGWDIKTLMEYVGWSDMKSALRYVEPAQQFGGLIRKLEG